MKDNIHFFLDRLKKGQEAFSYKIYDYKQYNCEMSDLCRMIYEENIQGIINFWKQKQEYNFFEMKHPIYNHIKTRAVFSIGNYNSNYVFFIDDSNKYIWCAIQSDTVFNAIIIDDIIYEIFPDWRGINFSYISNILPKQLKYKDIKFGFILSNTGSLWHFFYESLLFIYLINLNKPVANNSCLFFPKNAILSNENLVFLQPNCIKDFYSVNQRILLHKQLGEFVFKDSMLNYDKKDINHMGYDLVLWLSLVYRFNNIKTYIGQIESSINIIKELKKTFKKIKIYVDGLKSYENSYIIDNKVEEIINDLMNSIKLIDPKNIDIVNLNGFSVKNSIQICSFVDISIAESGSGAIIPVLCCRKPTILYGNKDYVQSFSKFCLPDENVKIVNFSNVAYCKDEYFFKVKSKEFCNYHIPWQHIYNLLAELLEELSCEGKIKIKNLKMKRLNVPSVDLIAKKYELEQKFGINISLENIFLYNEIEKLNINKVMQNQTNLIQEKDVIIQHKNTQINQLTFQIYSTAKARIQNQLSYKLGQAMIINSKSILGYIRMPFVLSYIKDKYKQEQKIYQEKIKKDPSLILPPLQNYPDFQEALKEKQCLTYKLGQALIKANKTWYKGGYIKLWFEIRKLKKEFIKKK